MWLKVILVALKLVSILSGWLERRKWKAEGKAEAYAEAKEVHDQRVAEANAARADADDIASMHDPYNRDNASRG